MKVFLVYVTTNDGEDFIPLDNMGYFTDENKVRDYVRTLNFYESDELTRWEVRELKEHKSNR